jgi:hypothetical protein
LNLDVGVMMHGRWLTGGAARADEAKENVRVKASAVNSVFLVQLRKTFAAVFAQQRR